VKKITAFTLSFFYNAREDRMLLLINKDTPYPYAFWITRRLYFSILFELDGYLDRLQLKEQPEAEEEHTAKTLPPAQKSAAGTQIAEKTAQPSEKSSPAYNRLLNEAVGNASLLKTVSISMTPDKKHFNLRFKSKEAVAASRMGLKDFHAFYRLIKKSMPVKEWGIM